MVEKNFSLDTFRKMTDKMIAKNSAAWDNSPYDFTKPQVRLCDYSIEQIEQIVANGSIEAQQLLSRKFFLKDGFYKWLIVYYATVLKYVGILIPNPSFGKDLSSPFIQKKFFAALDYLDQMRLNELLVKFSLRALIDGCYYGVIQKLEKDEFVLLDLPAHYCRSRWKDYHGNDIIEFDVTYFDSIRTEDGRDSALAAFPKVISKGYKAYVKSKTLENRWVKIPTEIGICFPFLDDGVPPFLNVIPSTIQYEEAVDTEREREREEIRKILVQHVPHLSDGTLLFEPEEAHVMHTGAVGMMKNNKNLSILTTYTDVDAIISKTAADSTNNNLEKMMQNIYYGAAVSSQIFSPTGNLAISTSIQNDAAKMMIMASRYGNFISYIINKLFGNSNVTFKYSILPVTWYNEKDYVDEGFKLAQSGYSFLVPSAAMGISQKDLINLKNLENDVLQLGNKLIPLSSSYTQSGSGQVGAPKKDDTEVSPKTIQNQESLDKQGD